MEDRRFEEVIRPLLAGALERAGAEAVQDAAIATWRAFPRLRTESDAAAHFERAVARAGRGSRGPAASASWSDDVIAVAVGHERRSPVAAHAPLAAAALVAAVVLAAVVGPRLGSLLPGRTVSGTRPRAATPPQSERFVILTKPSPSTAPEPDYGPAPAGSLIWGVDSREPNRLIAFDHAGAPVGTLVVPERASGPGLAWPFAVSPDGSTLWLGDRFVDREGIDLGAPAVPIGSFAWTDSPIEVCGSSEAAAGRWSLWTFQLDGPTRIFAQLSADSLVLAGCSVKRDLAVVAEMGRYENFDYVHRVDFVRLSSGALVGTRTEPGTACTSVVTSPDLEYFAENAATWPQPTPVPATTVRRVDGGVKLLTLAHPVMAFSADSRQVATGIFDGGPGPIYDLATAREVIEPGTLRQPWTPGEVLPVSGGWVFAAQEDGFAVVEGSAVVQSRYGPVTMLPTVGPFEYTMQPSDELSRAVTGFPASPVSAGPGLGRPGAKLTRRP